MKSNQQRPLTKVMPTLGRNRAINKTSKQAQPESKKAKLDVSLVSAFSLSITVLTAVLWGAGKAYRQNYLSVFGFDDAVMPWSFQDVVYLGITKQLTILLTAPLVSIGVFLLLAIVVIAMAWINNLEKEQRRRTARAATNRNTFGWWSNAESILELIILLIYCLVAFFVCAMLATFFVAGAETLGKKDAEKELAAISALKTTKSVKPQLSYAVIERMVDKRHVTEEGYVITCSDRFCGLYTPDKGLGASRLIVSLDHLVSFKYVQ
jgi:flagellar basal body-associated protein FliL